MAFLSITGDVSDMLDSWWQHTVPPDVVPVLVAAHQPGLEEWLRGIDGEAIVGVTTGADLSHYGAHPNVHLLVSVDWAVLAEFTMRVYADCFVPEPVESPERVGPGMAARTTLPPAAAAPQPDPPPASRPAPPPLEATWSAGRQRRAVAPRSLLKRVGGLLTGGAAHAGMPPELTTMALSHPMGRIVGVTSRAGGVGKTSVAAAVAVIYGEAVQDGGRSAAVVDQNIGNPDQSRHLSAGGRTRTVYELMADIDAGTDWRVPAWSRTPGLAIYPEGRDVADAYAPGQIERFAAQLRQRHAMSIIDMPDRLPSFASPDEALCAAWVGVADLLLMPTTDDPTRLQGVLDYLDVPLLSRDADGEGRRARVVVPYFPSPLHAIRDDPGVRGLLGEIESRVLAVVEVPKDERATLAIAEGRAITEIDGGLRAAYLELALTVARCLTEE
jgi:cellulose biosynthesis protein BcsQ